MWKNKLTHLVDQTETWFQLKEADSNGGKKRKEKKKRRERAMLIESSDGRMSQLNDKITSDQFVTNRVEKGGRVG